MIPALTIARSLSRYGARVDIASHLSTPISARSNCVEHSINYPNPLQDEQGFLKWLQDQIDAEPYDLCIPVTERTVVPLHRHRGRIEGTRLALAPESALEIALDKDRTVILAQQLGIRVPAGRAAQTIEDALAFASDHGYPVVVKPTASIGVNENERVHLSVSYALNEIDLRTQVAHALRHGGVLIQELFRGQGVGIELIADRGQIIFAFQHRRLHEVPLTGGGSSLRESVPVNPELLEASRQLMSAMQWHGVAMVEFKQDQVTGEFRLMEINGRFWGSLPLAVAAGADFPAMLLELLIDGSVKPRPAAQTGIFCRNLQKDIYWHELVLRRDAPPALAKLPSWPMVLRDLLLMFSPRHRFDVQQWRDPRPGIEDLRQSVAGYAKRGAGLLAERRLLRRQRAAWRSDALRGRLRNGSHLLFLCYGNINRSAVAELLAHQWLDERYVLESAGFHRKTERPADPIMVEVAATHGQNLSASRSKQLSSEMVERADAILVMESSHLERAVQLFPSSAEKTFLLGCAAPNAVPNGVIADPYGHDREVYEHCYWQIQCCIEALARFTRAGS